MIKIIRIIIINISPPKIYIVSQGVAGAANERPLEGVMEATARLVTGNGDPGTVAGVTDQSNGVRRGCNQGDSSPFVLSGLDSSLSLRMTRLKGEFP